VRKWIVLLGLCSMVLLAGCSWTATPVIKVIVEMATLLPSTLTTTPQPTPTATPRPAATAAPVVVSSGSPKPAGIWCAMNGPGLNYADLQPGCAIYGAPTSIPYQYQVTASIGSGLNSVMTVSVHDSWKLIGWCQADTADWQPQIIVILETGSWYVWGFIPCTAGWQGYEFDRIANITVSISVVDIPAVVNYWGVDLIQN